MSQSDSNKEIFGHTLWPGSQQLVVGDQSGSLSEGDEDFVFKRGLDCGSSVTLLYGEAEREFALPDEVSLNSSTAVQEAVVRAPLSYYLKRYGFPSKEGVNTPLQALALRDFLNATMRSWSDSGDNIQERLVSSFRLNMPIPISSRLFGSFEAASSLNGSASTQIARFYRSVLVGSELVARLCLRDGAASDRIRPKAESLSVFNGLYASLSRIPYLNVGYLAFGFSGRPTGNNNREIGYLVRLRKNQFVNLATAVRQREYYYPDDFVEPSDMSSQDDSLFAFTNIPPAEGGGDHMSAADMEVIKSFALGAGIFKSMFTLLEEETTRSLMLNSGMKFPDKLWRKLRRIEELRDPEIANARAQDITFDLLVCATQLLLLVRNSKIPGRFAFLEKHGLTHQIVSTLEKMEPILTEVEIPLPTNQWFDDYVYNKVGVSTSDMVEVFEQNCQDLSLGRATDWRVLRMRTLSFGRSSCFSFIDANLFDSSGQRIFGRGFKRGVQTSAV